MKTTKGLLILCIIGLFILGSCKNRIPDQEQSKPTVYLRLAENQPPDHPTTQADKEFARLVEEKTNGRIVIKVYDSEQLGPENEILEQLQFGGIDFARVSAGMAAQIAPQLNVLQLPYIYKDSDHMWRVLNSEIGEFFLESIADKNLIGLTWYDAGARNFYNSIREIKTLADLEGLKVRVMENQMLVDMAKALGTYVIPMPYGEVYSAMQRGIIDGAENNYPSYDTSLHYEVAKYYTIDEHVRIPEMLIASQKIRDRLSEVDLEIIRACAKESQVFQRKKWLIKEKESEQKLIKAGVIITEIENRSEFVKAVRPLYDQYASNYLEIVKQIQDME
ncbi:TRAP transporter substrate-binding protein [Cellulosilyticum sp. I15G10I2]|uniref:TRAP transporter substrate-binding protein n=1 Tax=Cellulosilyticum sp. I15G10I2 TaxID=1892843 RepID=UPI00085BF9D1|nr:TRAP transporter substrate-binding protein [Cellulosilyticum sp. I15G10I2]